jgi:serine/threonine-protein kinase
VALEPGSSVGPYEVVAKLGAGGMGEVYRARDTRLNRDVAIKTLPSYVAMDRERAERFDREAKLLAALNHPHIAGIHGLEQSAAGVCLVLELVDGESLAAKIGVTPIPVGEALRIARQIADALLAAHDKGIIHRDLKPANVMLTADGQVKVLDFGLGKVVESDPAKDTSNSPTMTLGATQVGMLLGTAAYMSPEQAKGQNADKRSDVWAFGCVLFEMLTGTRAFQGDDVSDTLAAVLKSEPAWAALPADVPPAVRALLEGCLDKSRRSRLADVSAAIFVIDRHQNLGGSKAASEPPASPPLPMWKRLLPLAETAVGVAALVSLAWWAAWPAATPGAISRFVVPLTEEQTFSNSARRVVAVSPDGTAMVFSGGTPLYIRRFGELNAQAIPGADKALLGPVFSPDGGQIAYWSAGDRQIKRIGIGGGAPVPIRPAAGAPFGMQWGEAGLVVGLGVGGVVRISDRGDVEDLVKVEPGEAASDPQLLPGGRHLLVTIGAEVGSSIETWDKARIVVYNLDTKARTVVRDGANGGRYIRTGHLLYAVGGTIFAAPFDLREMRESGPSVPVVEGVRRGVTGVVHYDVSPSGVLAYAPGPLGTSLVPSGLAFTDRTGAVEQLKLAPASFGFPRASKDGRSIAFELTQAGETSIWVYALAGSTSMRRLTLTGRSRHPVWSSDSQQIAFQSDREGDLGIFAQRADGTGPVTRLTRAEKGEAHVPESWSPNGQHLLYSATKGTEVTSWVLSVRDGRAEKFGGVTSSRPITAEFHPFGNWVAYSSDAGRQEGFVFVQPFPPTGEIHQVSKDGENGHHPMWSPDGKELFYIPQVGRFVSVGVMLKPTFTFTDPKQMPRKFAVSSPVSQRPWDIARDGRTLSIYEAGVSGAPELRVVLNWFEELTARVPVR